MSSAIILTSGFFDTINAKTTHGLIRGPSRYDILGVVDEKNAGRDAGEALDGRHREIPIRASVEELLSGQAKKAEVAVLGVATVGGVIPKSHRRDVIAAAGAGLSLVNGLHHLISDDKEVADLVAARGGEIIDLRKPRPASELHFWSGEILDLQTPRIAVLGMDCAIGKRTTTMLLREACIGRGVATEVIYTGQTGWLQGLQHGFILDATANDFVAGEFEYAILSCVEQCQPDLILLEGQSSLRNPSGPCGSEFIVSAGAKRVVLQHAPARECFEGLEDRAYLLPPIGDEIALIQHFGAEVCAVCLHEAGLDNPEAQRAELEAELQLPVALPLRDMSPVVEAILGDKSTA